MAKDYTEKEALEIVGKAGAKIVDLGFSAKRAKCEAQVKSIRVPKSGNFGLRFWAAVDFLTNVHKKVIKNNWGEKEIQFWLGYNFIRTD